jgi:hypothetical protein
MKKNKKLKYLKAINVDIKMAESKDYIFMAEITDAYSFRMLIQYLDTFHKEGEFIFTKDGITFLKANDKQDLINDVTINPKELVRYEFNSEQPLTIGCDLSQFKTNVASIGKNDSVRWLLKKGADYFITQIVGTNSKDYESNAKKVKIKNVETDDIELADYCRKINDPNFVSPLSDFAKACKPISKDCEAVCFNQYRKGVKIEKIVNEINPGQFNIFGTVDEKTDIIHSKLKISSINIKNLNKLNNMSTKSNIRFYFEDEMPTRLSCNIGVYGILVIHMKNPDE